MGATDIQLQVRRFEAGKYYADHNGYHVVIQRRNNMLGPTGEWEAIVCQHGKTEHDPYDNHPMLITIHATKREAVAEATCWLGTYGDKFAN